MHEHVDNLFAFDLPGLLVSVRDATEAVAALAAGADVIDVKEPRRGSLGAADSSTIQAVVEAVAGRAMVTAALGELRELERLCNLGQPVPLAAGVSLFKIGLSGCRQQVDWHARWSTIIEKICRCSLSSPQPVAVVYADWETAGAPEPLQILEAAVQVRCAALLIDTWDKSHGSLFAHWRDNELASFIRVVHATPLPIVLAGSLAGADFRRAAGMLPELVAVRGAACDAGREGAISTVRIAALKSQIANFQNRTCKTR